MNFKSLPVTMAVAGALLLAGCSTRSISNSGFDAGEPSDARPSTHRFYAGELREFDVLGIDLSATASDATIQSALDSAQRVRLRPGGNLLLIQSGAFSPDAPMQAELSRYFNVVPFTGRPEGTDMGTSYSRALRFAAAQAGCESIVCYWGVLESAQENYETKVVSWVPVVGWMLPDERQHMRLRMKVAVVDVRSGHWTMFNPDPVTDAAASAVINRASSDQRQVEKLKQLAYTAAAGELRKTYAN